MLAEPEDADLAASVVNTVRGGNVRMMCPPVFATHQFVPRLPVFRQWFTRIQLELAASGPVAATDEHYDVSVGQQPFRGDCVVRQLMSSRLMNEAEVRRRLHQAERSPWSSLREWVAAIKVASTTVPSFSNKPLALSVAVTVARIWLLRSCVSSM